MIAALRASLWSTWLIVGLIAYWSFAPYRVIDPFPAHPVVVTPRVVQGGVIHMRAGYTCKRLDIEGIISRTFVDGLLYATPPVAANRRVGCRSVDELIAVAVPASLPSGRYRLEQTFTYQVNPIRTITYRNLTTEFEVVAAFVPR